MGLRHASNVLLYLTFVMQKSEVRKKVNLMQTVTLLLINKNRGFALEKSDLTLPKLF